MVCCFLIIEIHIINVTVCQMYQPSIYHGLSSSKKNLGYVFCRVVVVVEMFHFFKTRQPFLAAELAAAKMPSATLLLTLLDWDHMKEVLEAEADPEAVEPVSCNLLRTAAPWIWWIFWSCKIYSHQPSDRPLLIMWFIIKDIVSMGFEVFHLFKHYSHSWLLCWRRQKCHQQHFCLHR